MREPASDKKSARPAGGAYARYVLGLLMLIYAVSFIDRQLLSILAEDIKADLGIGDAQMGFLYGTVFAVFYALCGIPLGRLADSWSRVRLLSIGLALWSAMTAASGLARNFAQLAGARVAVGIGQASSAPAAFSILADYFPPHQRATAISIYSSGVSIGAGLSLFLGGFIVDRWPAGQLGLVGWQAAFLLVGLPGLMLAGWFSTIAEPWRGQSEGLTGASAPAAPFRGLVDEVMCILPPLTFIHIARFGRRAFLGNLLATLAAFAMACILGLLVGNWWQWLALATAAHAVFTWQQSLGHRDPPTHRLIWRTPVFLLLVLAFSLLMVVYYAWGFWSAPYAIRVLGAERASAGLFLGLAMASGGFLSVIIGGRATDWLLPRNQSAGILVTIIGACGAVPFFLLQFTTRSLPVFYLSAWMVALLLACWGGIAGATFQDLVLPRMRGAAIATYILGLTVIGLGTGPFLAGWLSEYFHSLGHAMLCMLLFLPAALLCLGLGCHLLPAAKATRIARAAEAGEPLRPVPADGG